MAIHLPPPSLTSRLSGATQDLRSRLEEVVGDVSSGRRADQVGFLKGDIGQAMLAQRTVDALALEKEQIALQSSRFAVIQRSLDAVAEAPGNIALDVNAAIGTGDAGTIRISADAAKVALDRIFSTLNTRHGERHLFSGDATDRPALGSLETLMSDVRAIEATSVSSPDFEQRIDDYFNRPDGGFQSTIYQGTASASSAGSVLATDPAFTALVSGLALVALAGEAGHGEGKPLTDDGLRRASETILQGTDKVTGLRARVGLIEADLQQRSAAIETQQTLANQTLSDLTARDPFEAALELQQLETNLETAYALTARLSELSLLRFLR